MQILQTIVSYLAIAAAFITSLFPQGDLTMIPYTNDYDIPDSIPAPTAKAEIEINVNTANTLETVILFLKITTEASSKKAPNNTSQAL